MQSLRAWCIDRFRDELLETLCPGLCFAALDAASSVPGWLTGELHERLCRAGFLSIANDQIPISAVVCRFKCRSAVALYLHPAWLAEVEIATSGANCIENGCQIPGGPIMRRRTVGHI